MSKNTGGPAFPCVYDIHPQPGMARSINVEEGMTLRAYIATKALAALISRPDKDDVKRGSKGVPILAGYAVEYADALIAALDAK